MGGRTGSEPHCDRLRCRRKPSYLASHLVPMETTKAVKWAGTGHPSFSTDSSQIPFAVDLSHFLLSDGVDI